MSLPTIRQVALPAFDLAAHMAHDMQRAKEKVAKQSEKQEPDDDTCTTCQGTGEGQHEGKSCMVCRGRGY